MTKLLLSDFDFAYPPSAVATHPAPVRDESKLWVLDGNGVTPVPFYDLATKLCAGDLLVLNNTRVLPVRFMATRSGGGRSELVVTGEAHGKPLTGSSAVLPNEGRVFECLVSGSRHLNVGSQLDVGGQFGAELLEKLADGRWHVRLFPKGGEANPFMTIGEMPLPPYLRDKHFQRKRNEDLARYQTIYGEKGAAIAAPTAGLHFTERVFSELKKKEIETTFVTLDVSYGTFQPIRTDDFRQHVMAEEDCEVSQDAAEKINRAKREGRRVIAVGTTATRTLEAFGEASSGLPLKPGRVRTRLFIHTDFAFRVVDGLLTNFHLPQSSLLLLTCAFGGRERVLKAYESSISCGARLFSYGDAMLLFRG